MDQKGLRIVHYVNQFFGQEGGEEKAGLGFLVKEGPVGPGLALQKALGERGRVIATIVCGDNYFAEHVEKASEEAVRLIMPFKPDLLFAGPAFEAGRYGIACGAICKIVQERLAIPVVTGMFETNPGVDLLLAKLQGRPFQSEVELPKFQPIQPPPPIRKEMRFCQIALISDGGLVPKGNPHGLKGRGNMVWAAYEIEHFLPEDFSPSNYEVAHTGYYPSRVLENPNRLVPVDVLRELEGEGVIGRLHPFFYSTSGNGVIQKRCEEMGEEIVTELLEKGVDGALLTST